MTEELHHMAAAYALNALDEDERRAFEAHYPKCSICNDDVEDYRETAAQLGKVTATPPSPDLRGRVMGEIATTRQIAPIVPERVVDLAERKRRNQPRQRVLAVAAAAIVGLVGFAAGLRLAGSSDGGSDEILVASDAQTLELEGETGIGMARVVWSPSEDRAVLIADGLADPGEGNAYELWLIDADGPSPTGLFTPGDDGEVRVEVTLNGADPAAWGITSEPDTGSAQPTGEILFIAETA